MGATTEIADLRFPVLIGDIGGTNARFALIEEAGGTPIDFAHVRTADFRTIEAAIKKIVFAATDLRPKTAVIDMAGPVAGDAIPLTNAVWVLKPREIIAATGIDEVVVLNDFEALAMALSALGPEDLVSLGGPPGGMADAAKVVIGPGTGLGVGSLLHVSGMWIPVPGEGGHVSLGPAEPDEFALWPNIEPELGRISAEALLCGRGIVRLYRAVAKTDGAPAAFTKPDEITDAALAGSDPVAQRTMTVYCRLLGRVAGDVALTMMARGGAYIGGGIVGSSRVDLQACKLEYSIVSPK